MLVLGTKGTAAMAVLVEQCRALLDFDEPVARYWPEFVRDGKEHVILRHLLSQQSGLAALDRRIDLATVAMNCEDSKRLWTG